MYRDYISIVTSLRHCITECKHVKFLSKVSVNDCDMLDQPAKSDLLVRRPIRLYSRPRPKPVFTFRNAVKVIVLSLI